MRLKLAAACLVALAGAANAGDVKTISTGETVDIKTHLAKGKYTLFEFYADW